MNVGRNIARDAAMTHFILASDIELYPNPGLVKRFLGQSEQHYCHFSLVEQIVIFQYFVI